MYANPGLVTVTPDITPFVTVAVAFAAAVVPIPTNGVAPTPVPPVGTIGT